MVKRRSRKVSKRRRVSKKRSSRRRVSKKRSTKRRVSKKNKRSRQRGGVLHPDERGHRQPGTYEYPDTRPIYQREIDKLITKLYQSEDCQSSDIAGLRRQIRDINIDITRKRSAAATAAQKREAAEMTTGKRDAAAAAAAAVAAAAAAQKQEDEEEEDKTLLRDALPLLKTAIYDAPMATGRGDATASPSGSGAGADEETDGCTKYLNALEVLVNNISTQL